MPKGGGPHDEPVWRPLHGGTQRAALHYPYRNGLASGWVGNTRPSLPPTRDHWPPGFRSSDTPRRSYPQGHPGGRGVPGVSSCLDEKCGHGPGRPRRPWRPTRSRLVPATQPRKRSTGSSRRHLTPEVGRWRSAIGDNHILIQGCGVDKRGTRILPSVCSAGRRPVPSNRRTGVPLVGPTFLADNEKRPAFEPGRQFRGPRSSLDIDDGRQFRRFRWSFQLSIPLHDDRFAFSVRRTHPVSATPVTAIPQSEGGSKNPFNL